ncbi:MAG TPA: hypothetical protein VHE30_25565 [Polyangiaceae bacterium]|nr:hypothetical protein [Polyangiaceae bacterium]
MRTSTFLAVAGLLWVTLPGCGPAVVPLNPVTVVATRTPGVSMVIVRPVSDRMTERGQIDRRSEYVLLCDGRGADGMHCAIMPEVGGDRRSRGVVPDQPAPQVDEGLSTLADIQISSTAEGSVAHGTVVAPPASSGTPPPASGPPPAAAPPPPPPPAAPAGGAK